MPASLSPFPVTTAPAPHLLVCVLADGQAARLVDQARRVHALLGGRWSVLSLEWPDAGDDSRQGTDAMLRALDDAERSGAGVQRLRFDLGTWPDVVAAVVEAASRCAATEVLIGRPHVRSVRWRSPAERISQLADVLAERLPGTTVHVLALADAADGRAAASASASVRAWHQPWQPAWGTVAVVLLLCSLAAPALDRVFEASNLVMVYLVGITYAALRKGAAAAFVATLGSTLLFYLLFVPPRWSIVPSDPQYSFTFAVMLGVGLIIGHLAARARRQTQTAEARSQRAQALNQAALRLAQARTAAAVADAVSDAVSQAMGSPARLFVLDGNGQLPAPDAALEAAWHLAETALQQRRETGAGTAVSPDAPARFIPVLGAPGALGLLVASPLPAHPDTAEDEHLLRAFANQAALALERVVYERRSAAAAVEAEAERLRNTVLASVSHDFRTPLTTIVGSVTSLLEQGHAIDEGSRRLLLCGVLDQARRLHALSSDLLDMARMEEGAVRLNPEWCPADELVAESLAAMGERVTGHRLTVQAPADAIVWCDPRLLGQALVNLVDNAVRHVPQGAGIHVAVRADAVGWQLEVHDEGPGVPAGLEREVFKKFFRAGAAGGGTADGSGLGLAICAAVAQLHGGRIDVTAGPGARFVMHLPQPERSPQALEEDA